ncbi:MULTISPECIES: universal stress protein [unclassified Haladaptatus]|uniref:universal stress protein n=1 Tax=unclassified Haladaptatus TaxID=2622732 RepID=UPI0007B494DA|nr:MULTISPECIES: universal stress protein [unclassified Haladaptatus]KZN24767.1 universal stress protein UspA [Haladaptatus sp. R4]MCO8246875.1 universal stress protein [Haladaptatus sp. AB643]MCO8253599.1 universal stress protein [Haladaptatus sp. AB618]
MKVLLGIGGSDDSLTALSRTVERAVAADDELTVAILDNPESDLAKDDITEKVQAVLDDVGFDATVRDVSGDPGSRLLDIAESEGFEQIVLGGGQRSPMGKIRLGQIAEFVLLNSHVSVKLVR